MFGMPHIDITKLWVHSTGNTRVEISQSVQGSNGEYKMNTNSYSWNNGQAGNRAIYKRDMYAQMFEQQRQMYLKMADTWDEQGKNTTQLRSDLVEMAGKISQLKQETDMARVEAAINDLRQFSRMTIQLDIRSVMLQRT